MRLATIDLDTGEIVEPEYFTSKWSKLYNDADLKLAIKSFHSLNALKLWLLMVMTMQQQNKPTVSIEELAEWLGIHSKRIASTISDLKEAGLVTTNSLNELIPNPLYAFNGSQAQQLNTTWDRLLNNMKNMEAA